MEQIALVACVKEKLNCPALAGEMYIGDSFNQWMIDAKSRNLDRIYILSGKYGLLGLEDQIEPYDLNLGDQPLSYIETWKKEVISKLRENHDLTETHVIIYTNKVYYEGLLEQFNSYEIPFLIN